MCVRHAVGLVWLWVVCGFSIAVADDFAGSDIDELVDALPRLSLSVDDRDLRFGEFTLTWHAESPSAGYDFVRIQEYLIGPDGRETWWPLAVTQKPQTFLGIGGTSRVFRAQACLEINRELHCGGASTPIEVNLPDDALSRHPIVLGSELEFYDDDSHEGLANGGAGVVRPGQWDSSFAGGTSWTLFWANQLRRPSAHPLYQNLNHLFVKWYTYRDFAGPNPAPGQENLQPVWLHAELWRQSYCQIWCIGSQAARCCG